MRVKQRGPEEDETLVAEVARAQTEALSALYDRYSRLVYSLALHIVSDPQAAEEITQDVFVQLWNRASTYDPSQGKLISWLARMARNRSIDELRRRSVRPEGHSASWADDEIPDSQDDEQIEQTVAWSQEKHAIQRAIAQLPQEQQQVLALAYFEEYSHQQIADQLGEPLGTVKTRLRLAIQKLRHALEADQFMLK